MELNKMTAKELLEALKGVTGGIPEVPIRVLEERYLREKGRLAERTVGNYRWTFDRLEKAGIKFWFRQVFEVNEFMGSLSNLNDTSQQFIFSCLRAIGRYTKKTYGWDNPVENAQRPHVRHKQRRYFKDDELKAVVGACRGIEDKVLIMSLIDSGCRIKELCGLRVSDLEVDGFRTEGKTGKRHYRCDPRIVVLMREQAVDGIIFPAKDASRNVVCPAGHCLPSTLGERVRAIIERAGIKGEKLGPHTLRHTAASMVAKATRSPLAVKAILQQDDIRSSMVYIHDAEEVIQKGVSPLMMSGIEIGDGGQLVRSDVPQLESSEIKAITDFRELVIDLFPEVPDGVRVRPALDTDDLNLIRSGLIELMRVKNEYGSGSMCVQLMRRMLRRVKFNRLD